jgi:uncharacterized protein
MNHIDLTHLTALSYMSVLFFLVAAGATKGLIGIGMPIIAVPLLNMVLDVPTTVALLSIPLVATNIPQALEGDPLSAVLRRLAPIFVGLFAGVFAGVALLATLTSTYLKPIVGIVLLMVAVLMMLGPRVRVPKRLEPVAGPAVGVIGGLAGGLAALPGPFVFMYLLALGMERDRFVQYSSAFLTVAASLMTITLGGIGLFGWSDATISLIATIPILGGMWIGRNIRTLVAPELFRKVILGVVMVSGMHMVAVGLATR